MKIKFRYSLFFILALSVGVSLSGPSQAQSYPSKRVTMLVPFPPAGPMDILGRLLADRLGQAWGVPVVTSNYPGAGGNIGTRRCAESPPDGYTICILSIAQTIAPSIYNKPGFDPVKDFAHVSLLATLPSLLLVDPALPIMNVKDLVALAKAKPGVLNYASGGSGTSTNMLMELLKHQAGVNIVHIPYKGQGPALIDQVSGRISVAFATILAAQPYVRDGKLRAIAVSTKERFPLFPNVPTIDESGFKGFDGGSWAGLVMPAGTPRDIVNKVNADVEVIMNSSSMKEKILSMGGITVRDTPDEFTAFVTGEVATWAKVVKAAGISSN